MSRDRALGMFVGLFIGDALGAPLEFTEPNEVETVTEMIGGGWRNVAPGEWTDDGAMAMCIAKAYLKDNTFSPSTIVSNFKKWRATGAFGTRNYCFDAGRTCSAAIAEAETDRPYAAKACLRDSGNGSLMRLAPVLLANHTDMTRAIGEAVASALITHGNADTIRYVSAFARDVLSLLPNGDRKYLTPSAPLVDTNDYRLRNTVQYAYTLAHRCVRNSHTFEEALVKVVNRGGDADTNGAITGMLAGAMYGYGNIPTRWLEVLSMSADVLDTGVELLNFGSTR